MAAEEEKAMHSESTNAPIEDGEAADEDLRQGPWRCARARLDIATWNAQALGLHTTEHAAEEMEQVARRYLDFVCVQECFRAAAQHQGRQPRPMEVARQPTQSGIAPPACEAELTRTSGMGTTGCIGWPARASGGASPLPPAVSACQRAGQRRPSGSSSYARSLRTQKRCRRSTASTSWCGAETGTSTCPRTVILQECVGRFYLGGMERTRNTTLRCRRQAGHYIDKVCDAIFQNARAQIVAALAAGPQRSPARVHSARRAFAQARRGTPGHELRSKGDGGRRLEDSRPRCARTWRARCMAPGVS